MKDRTGSSDVWAIAGSTLLRDLCRALLHVVQPVNHLSGWARGCEAHGANCPEGRRWKGCRGPAFSARFEHARAELSASRETLQPDQFGVVGT
eukprot:3505967-Lingulodinium_polyedra.AAC.1